MGIAIKAASTLIACIYAVGFVGVFLMHTQMPATLGLALARSAAWPISLVIGEFWPRGTPEPMD